jgi:hypothetical protein
MGIPFRFRCGRFIMFAEFHQAHLFLEGKVNQSTSRGEVENQKKSFHKKWKLVHWEENEVILHFFYKRF